MALGGGVFVTQNKVLPGSYINFINRTSVGTALGQRGVVAIALALGHDVGKVIEMKREYFYNEALETFGFAHNSDELAPIREIFCNAEKVYVYDLGTDKTVAEACAALEPYEFNTLCAYTSDTDDISDYIDAVKNWRNNIGKKCSLVVYNTAADHEGIINVVSNVSNAGAATHVLTAWVAGADAGCAINASCTNKLYNGEYDIVVDKTQSQLETCLESGQFVFHLVYGEIRVLEDINSLTTFTDDKGEDFKYNQTIRVIDQIANDIAKLFNTKYLGKIPNDADGRMSLWSDIVAHHREMEEMRAIEDFNPTLLKVERGSTKKAVVVNDVVTVVNAMAQLYMTVIVQ